MNTWWHYDMETPSALLALFARKPPVSMQSLHKGTVMRSYDVFFVVRLNKLQNTHLSCLWFETTREVIVMSISHQTARGIGTMLIKHRYDEDVSDLRRGSMSDRDRSEGPFYLGQLLFFLIVNFYFMFWITVEEYQKMNPHIRFVCDHGV